MTLQKSGILLATTIGRLGRNIGWARSDFAGALRLIGLWTVAFGIAASSLTFNWVIEHRTEANFFPEFAGRVIYLSDVLLLAGVAAWLGGFFASPNRAFRYGPPYVSAPLGVLVLLTALSTLWAIDGAQAGFATVRILWLLAVYLVLVNEPGRAVTPVLTALLGVGVLQALVAIGQVAAQGPLGLSALGEISEGALGFPGIGSPRAYGLGFNPNPLGLYFAVAGSAAFGLYLVGGQEGRRRLAVLAVFVILVLGLEATQSRAAFLGWLGGVTSTALLSLILAGGFGRRTVAVRLVIAISLVLVAAGLGLIGTATVTPRESGAAGSSGGSGGSEVSTIATRLKPANVSTGLQVRLADMRLSGPTIRENLVLGVGASNYPTALKGRLAPASSGGIFTPVHSVPLSILAELGVLGGLAWAAIVLSPAIWLLRRGRRRASGLQGLLWLGPLLVLLAVGLLDFPPWATQDGRVLMWAILGLWAGKVSIPRRDRSVEDEA